MASTVEELAFELSRNAIEQQEKRQAELRSRAATVLAAASVAGSFLAGQAVNRGHLGALGIFAVLAYLGCAASTLYVLMPHELVLEFRGTVALEQADASRADVKTFQRAATGWLDEFHEANRTVLDRLGNAYAAACVLLGAEIVLWTARYADKVS